MTANFLIVCLWCPLLLCAAQRTTVSLDFGWRQATGIVGFAGAPATCTTPFVAQDGVRCLGLVAAPGSSASACAASACASGAALWQYAAASGCWLGSPSQATGVGCSRDATWSGGVAAVPPPAMPAWDDASWARIDVPHDFEIEGVYTPTADGGEAFLPQNGSYYVPSAWSGSFVELYIEGALSISSWFLNGAPLVPLHSSGYTSIIVRLDAAGLVFGGANTLVAFVDGTETTGWWYEGAGLVRHVWLTSTAASAHVATHSLRVPTALGGAIHARATTAAGLTADSGTLTPTLALENTGAGSVVVTLTCALLEAGVSTSTTLTVPVGVARNVSCPALVVAAVELWSLPRPYLHTLTLTLVVGGVAVDSTSTSVGFRSLAWSADSGLGVNGQPVKMRGVCEHESFAGVGAALADRVDLFRVQQLRGMGVNALRTSHNAPEPVLLGIMDRLGLAVLDENRVFATAENCPGCRDVPSWPFGGQLDNFQALIERDRTHASVVWWSACNEAGCGDGNGTLAALWAATVHEYDGTRAAGANMGWISPISPSAMSSHLDVMGFSHASEAAVHDYHTKRPSQPLVMTECCSCETQRGEDADMPRGPTVYYSNENSACVRGETQASDAVAFDAGTFVWTGHDYVGEPGKWPHVSSSFGSYDLAGFAKAPVAWYRAWWLSDVPATDAGRPPLPDTATTVHIVESWQAPAQGTTRAIHVLTNAPQVRLSVNGVVVGTQATPRMGPALFPAVPFAVGTLTASALDSAGSVLANASARSWGAPAALVLTLDAPSLATGTGAAVYADGQDVALVRARVVDAAGNTCADAALAISFAVSAGPGYVWATGNGDPADRTPAHAATKPAYHGLLRAIVRVSVRATGTPATRALEVLVNADAGAGGAATSTIAQGAGAPPTSFTVSATAPGLAPGVLVVPLSVDPADAVLATAAASVGAADTSVVG